MKLTKKTPLIYCWVQQIGTSAGKKQWCQCEEQAIARDLSYRDMAGMQRMLLTGAYGAKPSGEEITQLLIKKQIADMQKYGEPQLYSTRLLCRACLTRFIEGPHSDERDERVDSILALLFAQPTHSLVYFHFYGDLETERTVITKAQDIHTLMASLAAL